MLLARVAEGIYWIGRYTERVECTARIVGSHASLFFDIPVGSGVGWEPLLAVTGCSSRFDESRQLRDEAPGAATEAEVVRFLLTDRDNPASMVASLAAARNNLRSCRQRLPQDAWEALNRLYLYATELAPYVTFASTGGDSGMGDDRAGRFRYLSHLVVETQKLTGILHGTMSRDPAYSFFMLGQNLERADMTSRVLDVHAELLAQRGDVTTTRFDDVLWMYALKSLAAFQMFRRSMPGSGSGPSTLRFLLQDERFPRSVAFCLDEVALRLKTLSRADEALDACGEARRWAHEDVPATLEGAALHVFVDELQIRLEGIHGAVRETWLDPLLSTPAAAGTGR
ncbi:MAG: alpha-E domain-containing protein [Acidimicrobiia bacterium]